MCGRIVDNLSARSTGVAWIGAGSFRERKPKLMLSNALSMGERETQRSQLTTQVGACAPLRSMPDRNKTGMRVWME